MSENQKEYLSHHTGFRFKFENTTKPILSWKTNSRKAPKSLRVKSKEEWSEILSEFKNREDISTNWHINCESWIRRHLSLLKHLMLPSFQWWLELQRCTCKANNS